VNDSERSDADLRFIVPDELRPGVYANSASIWHSSTEFTIDWAVVERPDPEILEDSDPPKVSAIVVSRVRIPVSFVFAVLQGLNRAMPEYEHRYGEIRRPGEE
jgi:hypothetical protein